MKIVSFKAKNVRGYMDFDIKFNEQLNFLIGINGAGKTTVLKLLSGLLSPSIEYLYEIEFEYIEVVCIRHDKKIRISCAKNKKSLVFSSDVDGKQESFELPINRDSASPQSKVNNPFGYNEFYDYSKAMLGTSSFYEIYKREIQSPIFIGLDRLIDSKYSFGIEHDEVNHRRLKLGYCESVDKALIEIREKLYQVVRLNYKKQNYISQKFRKDILDDSIDFNVQYPNLEEFRWNITEFEKKKKDLEKTFDLLGESKYKSKIEDYFKDLTDCARVFFSLEDGEQYDEEKKKQSVNAALKLYFAQYQFVRFDKMANHSKEYEDSLSKIKAPLECFKKSVNMLLQEGGKEMIINEAGEVSFKIQTSRAKNVDMFSLSSGEKQIIIMFAHLAFSEKGAIFIIDEPELSLHLSWQEQFVNALLEVNPEVQYILATHAPAIISKLERKKFCIDLTRPLQ